jgi:hypothetical protein
MVTYNFLYSNYSVTLADNLIVQVPAVIFAVSCNTFPTIAVENDNPAVLPPKSIVDVSR